MPHATLAPSVKVSSTSIVSKQIDFWLLGGASILLWVVISAAQYLRTHTMAVESHFLQLGALFSIYSIFCNYPHFMMSYRLGYSQGAKFIFKNWFALILVPLTMIAIYALAYFKFESVLSERPSVNFLNAAFEKAHLGFRLGTLKNFGTEVLSLSVLAMYLTVGWHYSKQIFGCTMVYAHYEKYPFTAWQKRLLKASLFSVALFNFCYLAIYAPEYNSDSVSQNFFFNIPIISLGLPTALIPIAGSAVILTTLSVLFGVYFYNFRKYQRLPSLNLIVASVAFYIWWIPIVRFNEFYFLAVPFFHSLQYLLFAYRLEKRKPAKTTHWFRNNLVPQILLLFVIGFCAFELFPNFVDQALQTDWYLQTVFFTIAAAVFINIHHFFIDSVVWRFGHSHIRDRLLNDEPI